MSEIESILAKYRVSKIIKNPSVDLGVFNKVSNNDDRVNGVLVTNGDFFLKNYDVTVSEIIECYTALQKCQKRRVLEVNGSLVHQDANGEIKII